MCTPVPVKPTFLTQNSLCPPYCCAAAHFSHLPANRHQTQRARSRYFYRKTTCSCLEVRFNTENCKNEKISLKNRNQVQKKSKHYSHRREVMHKSEYPEEAILHCKVARSQTPSLAFFLSPNLLVFKLPHYFRSNIEVFTLLAHHQVPKLQKFFKFSIAPVGITLLLHLSGHYLPRHVFSIKETGFEDI